jgi:hypothetical protein
MTVFLIYVTVYSVCVEDDRFFINCNRVHSQTYHFPHKTTGTGSFETAHLRLPLNDPPYYLTVGCLQLSCSKLFGAIMVKINQDNLSIKCTLLARYIFKINQKLAAFEVATAQLLVLCLAVT